MIKPLAYPEIKPKQTKKEMKRIGYIKYKTKVKSYM